jgi:hypothetical protein
MTQRKRATTCLKLCPLLNINRPAHLIDQACQGPSCVLWVKLQKEAMNPNYRLVYQGCGLVVNVPWQVHQIKEEPKP